MLSPAAQGCRHHLHRRRPSPNPTPPAWVAISRLLDAEHPGTLRPLALHPVPATSTSGRFFRPPRPCSVVTLPQCMFTAPKLHSPNSPPPLLCPPPMSEGADQVKTLSVSCLLLRGHSGSNHCHLPGTWRRHHPGRDRSALQGRAPNSERCQCP